MSKKTKATAETNTGKHALVPKLRFPEFRNAPEWICAPLQKCAEFISEKQSIGRLTLHSYISTENLLPDYGGVVDAMKLPSVNSATGFLRNDVLISNIRPYLKKIWLADRDGGASNDVIVVRAGQELDYRFLSFVLRNDAFVSFTMKGAKGVKMPRGDVTSIKEYPLLYPNMRSGEQQKIGDCLSSVDELISEQAQKVEALKAHKKGLMQLVFPAEGETIPKLRFPEFRNAQVWGERELGTMATKVGSGITPTGGGTNYKTEGRPFVRSQNVGWGKLLLDDVAFIDEQTHQSFNSTEIKISDVLLNITGASIGRSAVADSRIAGGNVNQHVCIIRVKQGELNSTLLNQFLISKRGQKQIDSFQAGGNRQGLNFVQIRSFKIPLPPTEDEQRKIADCLSSIDELITMQAQRVEVLKAHKCGLMQKLFPVPEMVK